MTNMSDKQNTRKIQAEERRLQILDAALEVFAEKSYRGTSIKDIAAAAGMSQGLMYHYFTGKEELLKATIDHHSFLPELRRILPDQEQLPTEIVLKEIANRFLNTMEAKKSLVKILIRDVAFDPDISKAWSDICREGVSLMKGYIDRRIQKGEFKPHNSEITARSMLANMVVFEFTRDAFKTSSVTRAEYIDTVFSNMLEGIRNK